MPKRRANGEGSIYIQKKDANGKAILWAAQYVDNTGERRTLYGKTQQVVRDKLKAAIRESDQGIAMDKSKITFADWMVEWLETYQKPTVRTSTYLSVYERIYNRILPAFPNVLLKNLRTDMLQRFINEAATTGRKDKAKNPETGEAIQKSGGLSVASLSKIRMIIVQALDQAVEINIITSNVAKKVKLPKAQKKEVEVLSVEDQKKLETLLLEELQSISFAILLDLYTGLRMGELIGLKINDIDFTEKNLYVTRSLRYLSNTKLGMSERIVSEPKTVKGRRTIPLPEFIIPFLRDYIDGRNTFVDIFKSQWGDNWEDEGYLFVSMYGTTPSSSGLRGKLNRLLKKAGINHINFHALRHTFATRCIESGFDVKSLADILGHTDAQITLNVYTHSLSDQKRKNMDKLSEIFAGKGKG